MSVAFRRESDEEHLEPRFELPIPPGPNIVTARGLELVEARVRQLEAQLAAEPGEEQRKAVQRDLRYWRSRLASAQVAPTPSGDTVAMGTRVTIEQDGRTRSLTITGHDEADGAAGLLAFASPLGRALIGAEAGEEVEWSGSGGPLTIVSIEIA